MIAFFLVMHWHCGTLPTCHFASNTALVDMYSTLKECRAAKAGLGDGRDQQDLTCEVRLVGVIGGKIGVVQP